MSTATYDLKKHLEKELGVLPGSSQVTIHVLITPPRKGAGLFPHTSLPSKRRTKIFQQDYLILLGQTPLDKPEEDSLTTAVEIALYTFPSADAAIVYVSKVDSTGQIVPGSGSPSALFVKSILGYFISEETRPAKNVRVQLFARAQNQYLFPDSSLHPGKRVLTDAQLCKWWKAVFTDVVDKQQQSSGQPSTWRCFYILPGMTQMEAEIHIRSSSTPVGDSKPSTTWTYGHPYSPNYTNPFTLADEKPSIEDDIVLDIFDSIPTFSDDPKARFLVELAATNKSDNGLNIPKSPLRKKLKARHDSGDKVTEDEEEQSGQEKSKSGPPAISPNEFWERMGFRQECSMGAVTGFFVVDRVEDTEAVARPLKAIPSEDDLQGCIPTPTLGRITTSLMNLDFGSTPKARHATRNLYDSVKGLCSGLSLSKPTSEAAEEPPVLEDYYRHIVSTFTIQNPPREGRVNDHNGATGSAPTAAPVNVLQVRKKKRPAP